MFPFVACAFGALSKKSLLNLALQSFALDLLYPHIIQLHPLISPGDDLPPGYSSNLGITLSGGQHKSNDPSFPVSQVSPQTFFL